MNKGLKIFGVMMIVMMLILVFGVAIFAQGPANGATGQGPNFVDADGDGVCDNCGRMMGGGRGRGANFVDANGDGVCDNHGTFPNRQSAQ